MKKNAIFILILSLCFLVIPVSAVGNDNPYNGLWFNESLSYNEKVEEYKELLGFDYYTAFNKIDAVLESKGEDYFLSDRQNVIDGTVSYEYLNLYKRIALSNYELYGRFNCTTEQLALRDLIYNQFNNYYVEDESIQHDIENDCIPELNPLPSAITYSFPIPDYSTPQER